MGLDTNLTLMTNLLGEKLFESGEIVSYMNNFVLFLKISNVLEMQISHKLLHRFCLNFYHSLRSHFVG